MIFIKIYENEETCLCDCCCCCVWQVQYVGLEVKWYVDSLHTLDCRNARGYDIAYISPAHTHTNTETYIREACYNVTATLEKEEEEK